MCIILITSYIIHVFHSVCSIITKIRRMHACNTNMCNCIFTANFNFIITLIIHMNKTFLWIIVQSMLYTSFKSSMIMIHRIARLGWAFGYVLHVKRNHHTVIGIPCINIEINIDIHTHKKIHWSVIIEYNALVLIRFFIFSAHV